MERELVKLAVLQNDLFDRLRKAKSHITNIAVEKDNEDNKAYNVIATFETTRLSRNNKGLEDCSLAQTVFSGDFEHVYTWLEGALWAL